MKPFNLERALAGDPVVTRDGRPVKIAGYNPDAFDGKKVIGWVGKDAEMWNENGQYYGSAYACNFNLFMAPTERKEWIVRYQHGTPIEEIEPYIAFSGPFYSLKKAQRFAKDTEGSIHEITIIE
jgi:hypothetical protein